MSNEVSDSVENNDRRMDENVVRESGDDEDKNGGRKESKTVIDEVRSDEFVVETEERKNKEHVQELEGDSVGEKDGDVRDGDDDEEV